MCDEMVVRWLHSTFGGRFYGGYTRLNSNKHRPIYEWSIVGKEANKLLREVFIYLKLKKSQAEIAFEFAKTLNKIDGFGSRLSDEIITQREVLRIQMVDLNRRGVREIEELP
jgi:hypothetical protein